MLVILKGDFDISNMPGAGNIPKSNWHWRVGYIAYVMDLKAGLPTLTVSSPQGGLFRKALNNPNLPDDLPANPALLGELKNRTQALPGVPIVPPSNKVPYGSLIPGTPKDSLQKPNLPEAK
jgi:hypothetical protein